MSHREANLQNEPNAKRQKTNSTNFRRIDDCIPNMPVMAFDEHTPIEESPLPPCSSFKNISISSEHNNTTLSTCASTSFDEIRDLTIEKLLNMYDVVGDFTVNTSTETASAEQRPIKEINLHGAEVAAVFSEPKHISELPVELLTDTFNNLSLKDLCSVRQTSRQWREIAGYCFQQNYSFSPVCIREDKGKYVLIITNGWNRWLIKISGRSGIHAFIQFIRNIHISGMDEFKYFLEKTPDFQQLKVIDLYKIDFTATSIDGMKETFNKVEYLQLTRCKTDEHFIDHILDLSPNLKRLSLIDIAIHSETGMRWLYNKHPTLECFALTTNKTVPIATFLKNNPNIRRFEINAVGLWENRHSIQTAKIALDDLYIYLNDRNIIPIETEKFRPVCLLLDELYELGLFKRLSVYAKFIFRPKELEETASLRALVKLYVDCPVSRAFYKLEKFQSLEEFHFGSTVLIKDKEAAARNLINLKRIHVEYAHFGDIVPFIKHATKLREIILDSCDIGKYLGYYKCCINVVDLKFTKNEAFSEGQPTIIHLSVLNRERAKLPNAEKITLYVDETVYLATKRARNRFKIH